MPMPAHRFKRLVLGLEPSAAGRSMRFAVEVAELLHLDLVGLFLEDAGLLDLAKIPFAREFRPLGGGWQPIDLDRLSHELDAAARSVERTFGEAAKRLSTRCRFEVIRGRAPETIASISQTGDIVMIVAPVSPAGRATDQFAWLMQAASRSGAAVMLVPPRIARTLGPVVAMTAASDDPSIAAAAGIATAAREELVIVDVREGADDDARVDQLSDDSGLTVRHVAVAGALRSDPTALPSALHQLRERLIVMTRGFLAHEAALSIAAARRVPVLLIEPAEASD
jgi:hypothetical protein